MTFCHKYFMGSFFKNIQVRSNDVKTIMALLKDHIEYRAYISESDNDWITIYDEHSDINVNGHYIKLAELLSAQLSTIAFAFNVYHSDVLCYWLFDKGVMVDRFNSDPDYFRRVSDPEKAEVKGSAHTLIRYCRKDSSIDLFNNILSGDFNSAEERLTALTKEFDINKNRATASFEYYCQRVEYSKKNNFDYDDKFILIEGVNYQKKFQIYNEILNILVTKFDIDEHNRRWLFEDINSVDSFCSKLTNYIKPAIKFIESKESLIDAVIFGDIEWVDQLLSSAEIDINYIDAYGRTALIWATLFPLNIIVDSLIKRGANLNIRDKVNNNALEYAKLFGHKKIIGYLEIAGAQE